MLKYHLITPIYSVYNDITFAKYVNCQSVYWFLNIISISIIQLQFKSNLPNIVNESSGKMLIIPLKGIFRIDGSYYKEISNCVIEQAKNIAVSQEYKESAQFLQLIIKDEAQAKRQGDIWSGKNVRIKKIVTNEEKTLKLKQKTLIIPWKGKICWQEQNDRIVLSNTAKKYDYKPSPALYAAEEMFIKVSAHSLLIQIILGSIE